MRAFTVTVALTVALVLVTAAPACAKHHFRRVYANSRTLHVRHAGVEKEVPVDAPHAVWRSEDVRLLPSWPPHTIQNSRGIRYRWMVYDDAHDLVRTVDRRAVGPSVPRPRHAEPLRVEDWRDSFAKTRNGLRGPHSDVR